MSTASLSRSPTPRGPAPDAETDARPETIADLLDRLGGIPANRVRWTPTPGTATEADLIRHNEGGLARMPCELVEATLVEKTMGVEESDIAILIASLILAQVRPRRLGQVLGADGMIRLFPGLLRAPDVSFLSRARFPGGKRPKGASSPVAPDLAVEVLSRSNSKKEMERKLREYFGSGVRLVWMVDPRKKTVRVHTSPTAFVTLTIANAIDGGDLLPGLVIPVRELFERD